MMNITENCGLEGQELTKRLIRSKAASFLSEHAPVKLWLKKGPGCLVVQEEDVEEEKRQQLILLQELEEQKSRLEQLLLEAQQEREQLKAEVPQHPVASEVGTW